MNVILQFFWIVLFTVLGDIMGTIIPVNVPGAVYGLILLFVFLHNGWLEMEKVEDVGLWLANNMALMFVPAGVGIMNYLDQLFANWWQISLVITVMVFFLLITIAFITNKLSKYDGKENVE